MSWVLLILCVSCLAIFADGKEHPLRYDLIIAAMMFASLAGCVLVRLFG